MASVLIEARLPEGTPLLPEGQLMNNLGCSQTALRGALRLLESWGLISVRPGRNGGLIARHPRSSDLRALLSILIHSRQASFSEVLVARRTIDPLIASEAARLRTDEQAQQLRWIIDQAAQTTEVRDPFVSKITELYLALADAAGMSVLGVFVSEVSSVGNDAVHRIAPASPMSRLSYLEVYEGIVQAIEASDPKAAESRMAAFQLETELYWRRHAPFLLEMPLRPLAAFEP
jgi:DNA-binding FadR family transcriptional regulator